jgi:RNA polymerase sigma factor (sigma-70 family)
MDMKRIDGRNPQEIDLWTLAPHIGCHTGLRFGIENQVRNGFSLIRLIAGATSATRDDYPESEFEKLAIPLLNSTYNFARWLVRNDHEAEDLVQETYLKALGNFSSFRSGTNFRAWIFRILRNTFLNSRSKLDRRMTVELSCDKPSLVTTDPDDPESLLIEQSTAAAIWDAIEQLPRSSREVILLSDVEDFAYREIAEILGVPIGTVMSRLARARRSVRRALGPNPGICIRRVPDNRNGCTSVADRMIANG